MGWKRLRAQTNYVYVSATSVSVYVNVSGSGTVIPQNVTDLLCGKPQTNHQQQESYHPV